MCVVHYTGKTIRGKVFETSDRGGTHEPLEVKPNEVIEGWKEGLMLMREGRYLSVIVESVFIVHILIINIVIMNYD